MSRLLLIHFYYHRRSSDSSSTLTLRCEINIPVVSLKGDKFYASIHVYINYNRRT